jgi:hypothetical protein
VEELFRSKQWNSNHSRNVHLEGADYWLVPRQGLLVATDSTGWPYRASDQLFLQWKQAAAVKGSVSNVRWVGPSGGKKHCQGLLISRLESKK